jgi:glycosyltransferase involved in cell wall biosynthesis
VRGLAGGLRDVGIDVSILSLYPDGLNAQERAGLGVPAHSLERRGRGDVLGFYPRLVRAIRTSRPDIVHAHVHAGKYAGRIGAIVSGVRTIVFTEHGDELGGLRRAVVNRVLHARTAAFVVFSETQRRAFGARERVPLARIVVIPNGVGEPPPADRERLRAELGLEAGSFACFVPARLTEQKDPLLAVRAFALAFRDDLKAHLFFAGTGPLEVTVRKEAATLGITEQVTFLGFRDDAPRLMRAMDALLMASVWEGMPLALGEAMYAGLAVVTTPWHGHETFVRDGHDALVAARATPGALARALERLRDHDVRSSLAARARTTAEATFSLEASVAAHAALYERLAGRR